MAKHIIEDTSITIGIVTSMLKNFDTMVQDFNNPLSITYDSESPPSRRSTVMKGMDQEGVLLSPVTRH